MKPPQILFGAAALFLLIASNSVLVEFMKTLTDNTIATETKWSNPFCETNLCFDGSVKSGAYQSS